MADVIRDTGFEGEQVQNEPRLEGQAQSSVAEARVQKDSQDEEEARLQHLVLKEHFTDSANRIQAENEYGEARIDQGVAEGRIPSEKQQEVKDQLRAELLVDRAKTLAAVDTEQPPEKLTLGYLVGAADRAVHRIGVYEERWDGKSGVTQMLAEFKQGISLAADEVVDQILAVMQENGFSGSVDQVAVQQLIEQGLLDSKTPLPEGFNPGDPSQMRELMKQTLPIETLAPFMVKQHRVKEAQRGDISQTHQENEAAQGSTSPEDQEVQASGELDKEQTKLERAGDWAKDQLYYQMFDNKQNNLEVFLKAFFGSEWRDLSGYASFNRLESGKERAGSQLGSKTMKDALGGGEQIDITASLFRAVIQESAVAYPNMSFSINGKTSRELVGLQGSALMQELKTTEGRQQILTLLTASQAKDSALMRLSAWVKGESGPDEPRRSRTQLDGETRARFQKNLPRDGSYGVTQEALSYLLTRIS